MDFYVRHAGQIPDKRSPEIQELSSLLNLLQTRLGEPVAEDFRNTNGVYMKLMNFSRCDPHYPGVGLAHGNADEQVVWDLYANKPAELAATAAHIASAVTSRTQTADLPPLEQEEEEAEEGQVLSRLHRYRERDRDLVKRKKQKFLEQNGRLFCEACGFDFLKVYGERGRDFIECHHTKSVSQLEVGEKTKLTDLALLCSNCHRMVHRRKPWLQLPEILPNLG